MTPSLLVIVPSRGRPHAVQPFVEAWLNSDPPPEAEVVFCVDSDDDTLPAYREAIDDITSRHKRIGLVEGPPARMVPVLNRVAVQNADRLDCLGFMGDDHRFHGPWAELMDTLTEDPVVAYGDDLYQGSAMATAVFMSSSIIRALGKMAPEEFQHLKVDQVWVAWGEAIDRLRYLPDVKVPHLHPYANPEIAWDERYQAANDGATCDADAAAYDAYMDEGGFDDDVAKLRALL